MKDLQDYQEEIYKCSKCGLCQSVCPIYKATKNEFLLSRGKFTILNGLIQGHLKVNNNIIKNLDLCLNCNICKNFCPSNINAKDIFAAAKNEFKPKTFLSYVSYPKIMLQLLTFIINAYRLLMLDKLTDFAKSILLRCGFIGRKILLFNSIIDIKVQKQKKIIKSTGNKKVIFFEGCFNKYINPSSKNAVLNLLQNFDYKILSINTGCCGISDYYNGQFEIFSKNAEKIIKKIPKDIEYIICDCDSCISVLKNYSNFFREADFLNDKIISINDFLVINKYKIIPGKTSRISYHKPCHNVDNSPSLLQDIQHKVLSQSCCGFAGHFGIKHNKLSTQISVNRAQEIKNANIEVIITSCPSCIIGLKQGLIEINNSTEVMNLSEFLNIEIHN